MCFKTKYHVLLQGVALRYVVAAALGHDFSRGDLTVMTFAGLSKKKYKYYEYCNKEVNIHSYNVLNEMH